MMPKMTYLDPVDQRKISKITERGAIIQICT